MAIYPRFANDWHRNLDYAHAPIMLYITRFLDIFGWSKRQNARIREIYPDAVNMDNVFKLWFDGKSRYFSPKEISFLGGGNTSGPGKGLNTPPPSQLWPNILPTLQMADALRELYGKPVKILSAYRSPEYNKAIGGAKNSFHRRFMALDLAPLKGGKDEIERLKGCAEILIKKGVLTGGVGRYSWGVHIDCGPRRDF